VSSPGGVTGVWASGQAERGHVGCSNTSDPAASGGLARVAFGTWVAKSSGR
jgi:hypothetical protein